MTVTAGTAGQVDLVSSDLYGRLVRRIVHDEEIDVGMAERIMAQALAFLKACALNPGAGLMPSKLVDIGWHTFVLHTREYAAFCERAAGRFIHHAPSDTEAAAGNTATIGVTVAAMRAAGLPVDTELWFLASECSQCYSGCADDPKVA